ncbi:MAG: hypothetical protein ACOCP4_04725 [Candidatus Woesearchaeota archaeon]
MNIVFLVSTLVFGIGILLAIFSKDKEYGIILIIISILFGYGFFGILLPSNTKLEEQKKFSIIKTPYRVIIDTGEDFKSFTNMKYRNIKKEDIIVYKKKYLNMYKKEISDNMDDIVVKFKEE